MSRYFYSAVNGLISTDSRLDMLVQFTTICMPCYHGDSQNKQISRMYTITIYQQFLILPPHPISYNYNFQVNDNAFFTISLEMKI